METIFITGGSGYLGSRLIKALDPVKYRILVLVRPGSERKVPENAEPILADVFHSEDWENKVPEHAVFVHLIGVSHPSPFKSLLFEQVDLRSAMIVAEVAKKKHARKFVFLSVAMEPGFIMRDFQMAKKKAEDYIQKLKLSFIFLRPWYILGPGHRWPFGLIPIYKLLELIPSTRKKALAFGLVTINQMIQALVTAILQPSVLPEIMEVKHIQRFPKNSKTLPFQIKFLL